MGQDYSYTQPSSSSEDYDITSQLQAEADLYAEEGQSNYKIPEAVRYIPQLSQMMASRRYATVVVSL
ncbi:hypothetical protein Bca101_081328 [Brassica carinata]